MPSGSDPASVSMKTAKDRSIPMDMVDSMVDNVIATPLDTGRTVRGRAARHTLGQHGHQGLRQRRPWTALANA